MTGRGNLATCLPDFPEAIRVVKVAWGLATDSDSYGRDRGLRA